MDIKEFGQMMIREVGDILGEGYDISLKDIEKNNGIIRHALVIKEQMSNVAPTIYIDDYHRQYERGAMLMMLVGDLVRMYKSTTIGCGPDVEFFSDFSMVAPKLFFKVVNYGKNRRKLKDIPIKKILDLALVPVCRVMSESFGDGCITIRKDHLKMWEISEDELWENTLESAVSVSPVSISGLLDVVEELTGRHEGLDDACGIYVATNTDKNLGAGVIFYPDILKGLAEYHESDLFIIPSSIHEVLIIPDTNMQMDVSSLRSMIHEVNSTAVGEEDILSDNLYMYDRESDRVFIVKG